MPSFIDLSPTSWSSRVWKCWHHMDGHLTGFASHLGRYDKKLQRLTIKVVQQSLWTRYCHHCHYHASHISNPKHTKNLEIGLLFHKHHLKINITKDTAIVTSIMRLPSFALLCQSYRQSKIYKYRTFIDKNTVKLNTTHFQSLKQEALLSQRGHVMLHVCQ